MNNDLVAYIGLAVCFVTAVGAVGFWCFIRGYNSGWEERHKDMILPRNVVARETERQRRSTTTELLSE